VRELPDIVVYLEALEGRVVGQRLQAIRLGNPFLLRTVRPTPAEFAGRRVLGLRRLGKRIVLECEGERFIVLHLMIAGRLHWRRAAAPLRGKNALAAFDFADGALILTEAGSQRRASLHLVAGEAGLREHDRGGLEPLEATRSDFRAALTRENHTLKRALTDPRLFSGIGNAYSDEILHRARLSPLKWTSRLTDEESAALHAATGEVLREWIQRLRTAAGDGFPKRVTAFHPQMAVHGKFGRPCPACGGSVARIRYAANEANYCPACQTGGKLLADRALSRLLKDDWPRTMQELEEQRRRA